MSNEQYKCKMWTYFHMSSPDKEVFLRLCLQTPFVLFVPKTFLLSRFENVRPCPQGSLMLSFEVWKSFKSDSFVEVGLLFCCHSHASLGETLTLEMVSIFSMCRCLDVFIYFSYQNLLYVTCGHQHVLLQSCSFPS